MTEYNLNLMSPLFKLSIDELRELSVFAEYPICLYALKIYAMKKQELEQSES